MEQMTICIDISRCTACRACQVACKNWNQLKAEQTENRGSHENPPDLSGQTWNRIVFMETRISNDGIDWAFFSERCRHCDDPPCIEASESVPGAIIRHDSGAVLFTEKTQQLEYDDVLSYCPYDIPRKDKATGRINKCTMCVDRVTHGLKPACVTACSTGALNFGPRPEMLRFIEARIKALGGDANIYPGEDHNTIWILPENRKRYPLAQAMEVRRPYRRAARGKSGAVLAGVLLTAGLVKFRERVQPNPSEEKAGQ